ncbi:hypothetical protein K492DRAFT_209867 [Lichtheimia hyalospora FSU 10163]|nr:hypothetical protein K492DRAFT_209867 [Lichtheimia hyalospora FSU 10163]
MNGEHSFRSFPHPSSASLAEMVVLHNPIQLAAISNYKLAQLTFAPPNIDSLRKTALVKNMLEVLYRETPSECLNQMTRWVFFTPESLSDMTQEGLEEIFAQYAQTIEAFQPLDDEDDQEADRIWEEHYMWRTNDDDEQEDDIRNASGSTTSEASTIFSQPHAIMSSEMIQQSPYPPSPPVSLADKPLPQNPPIEDIPRRKSLTPSVRSRNRLSWTSDTGVALSGSMVQTMASDMMNLFDMNFSVDIKLNTAPKLPELPFPQQQCQQRKRLSNDSLMGLIPTFETFTLDDDPSPHSSLSQKPKRKSRLSQSWSNSFVSDTPLPPLPSSSSTDMDHSIAVSNLPTRSSSLAYRKQHQQQQRRASQPTLQNPINPGTKRSDFLAGLWGAAINGSHNNNNNDKKESKNLSHSKSMRRLASLVKGTKKKASKSSPSLQYVESLTSSSPPEPPVKDHLFNKSQHSLCSIASSTSSCSTSTAQVMVARKTSFRKPPQKEESTHDDDDHHLLAKRRSFTMLRPVVVEAQEIRRARSVGHRDPSRRRLAAKMETQRSLPQLTIQEPLQPQPTLSRSKSALKKLSRGLSQRRRNNKQSQEHGMVDHQILPAQQDTTTNKNTNTNAFVKRMTSLGRRIRLHTI